MGTLTELSLFSGYGGFTLGLRLTGVDTRTVCYVEWDTYCQQVLCERITEGHLDDAPIWDDIATFDGKPWRGHVDIVTGGFPCQDLSVAGNRAGLDGARSGLWWEMLRVIREVGPRYVLIENVPGILLGGQAGSVVGELSAIGYDAVWHCVPAAAVGAPHLRWRWWCLAYPNAERLGHLGGDVADASGASSRVEEYRSSGQGRQPTDPLQSKALPQRDGTTGGEGIGTGCNDVADAGWGWGQDHELRAGRNIPGVCRQDVADTERNGLQGNGTGGEQEPDARQQKVQSEGGLKIVEDSGQLPSGWSPRPGAAAGGRTLGQPSGPSWWSVEPPLGRVADGVADRVGQLRALGNGVVPAVVARFLRGDR